LVQRALASQRCAVAGPGFQLARQNSHDGIVAQFIMIVEVFVAQGDPDDAWRDQGLNAVLDEGGFTVPRHL
jgi:hypothetical protein